MSAIVSLIKGFPGKPSHAPLTDVSIGAYTVGVAMLVVGAFGYEEEAMAKGGLLAISGGLIVAVPTSLTGLLDWADLAKGTAKRTIANFHLIVMVLATATFAGAWVTQRPGYMDGEVTTLGLVLAVAAFGLLILGGTLGGALAYVYGVRVVKKDVSVMDALIPGRLDESPTSRQPQYAPQQGGDVDVQRQSRPSGDAQAQAQPQAAAPAQEDSQGVSYLGSSYRF